jgi:hypothetical protein
MPNHMTAGRSARTKPARKRCVREGCTGTAKRQDRNTCSFTCSVICSELERAQRVCEATGDTAHWVSAVALNDALTDYYRSDSRVYHGAMDAGFTASQWRDIKRVTDKG